MPICSHDRTCPPEAIPRDLATKRLTGCCLGRLRNVRTYYFSSLNWRIRQRRLARDICRTGESKVHPKLLPAVESEQGGGRRKADHVML